MPNVPPPNDKPKAVYEWWNEPNLQQQSIHCPWEKKLKIKNNVFYYIWYGKKDNEIQLTKNKISTNNKKIKNHPHCPKFDEIQ